MISIRAETPEDYDAIRQLIVDAFSACELGYNGEADLVDQLRNECDSLLAFVAIDGDAIVGHIFFSPVSVQLANGMVHGMGLAPMAVRPNRQQTGIGTALVESGLKHLTEIGCSFVVVLGHPEYYPRFGFWPAREHGLTHGFDGIPQDVFFINILDQNAVQSLANGTAIYLPAFGPQRNGTGQSGEREPPRTRDLKS